MRTISLSHELNLTQPLEEGNVVLTGSTGINYRNKALRVPGYGWVPCSRKLKMNFSNKPEDLMLVIEEDSDPDKCVTSDIWITKSNIVAFFSC